MPLEHVFVVEVLRIRSSEVEVATTYKLEMGSNLPFENYRQTLIVGEIKYVL